MEVNLPRNTNFDNVLKSSFLVKTCLIGERRIISSSSEISETNPNVKREYCIAVPRSLLLDVYDFTVDQYSPKLLLNFKEQKIGLQGHLSRKQP